MFPKLKTLLKVKRFDFIEDDEENTGKVHNTLKKKIRECLKEENGIGVCMYSQKWTSSLFEYNVYLFTKMLMEITIHAVCSSAELRMC